MSSLEEKNIDIEKRTVKEPELAKRLLTPLLSKKVPSVPLDEERATYPYPKANLISKIFFFWLIPLLNRGYKRTLEYNDLWILDEESSITNVYEKFKAKLEIKLHDHEKSSWIHRFTILRAILSTFKWQWSLSFFFRSLANICQVVSPLLIKHLIQNVEERIYDPHNPIGPGVGYAFGIVLIVITNTLLVSHTTMKAKTIGAHTKSILTKALLEKSITASAKTKFDFPPGKVVSLMSGDLSKVDMGLTYVPNIVTFPIPMVIGVALLVSNIGVAALAGLALFFVGVPLLTFPARWFMLMREKVSEFTDERVSLIRQVLDAMKMIKFYSWEDAYEDKIIRARNKEMSIIFRIQLIINFIISMILSLPTFSSMLAFLTLYCITPDKNPGNIFSSLALFNVLSGFATDIPVIIAFCSSGLVGLDRITEFLESPNSLVHAEYDQTSDPEMALELKNGDFEWEDFNSDGNKEHKTFHGLKDISLEVRKGDFIVVTGPIGSGKSSLLAAIAGIMKQNSGSMAVDGSLMFCGVPWLQNATVKENITFGVEFDAHRYHNVLRCCALEADLRLLPAGDMTEIGERGVTLSGGQKARINLARAVYCNKDIYLFDDVLSAVDANVGKHIVENCFLELISQQTRILATHQLSLVSKADKIVFMNGDGSIDVGTTEELLKYNDKFRTMMNYIKTSTPSAKAKKAQDEIRQVEEIQNNGDGKLIGEEQRAINSIPFSIYKQYVQAGQGIFGKFVLPLLLISITSSIFVSIFTNVWLSFWVDDKFSNSNGFYIGIYVMLVFLSFFLLSIEVAFYGYVITEASKNLNLKAVTRILHTPMSFLDTTPIGRILNRFTKDTNSLDNEIGEQMKTLLHDSAEIIGILILCVIYLPWFAIAIPPLIIIFVLSVNYYQATSREVKRLEALRRSFVYNNFNEVLGGMETIKAHRSEGRFIDKNDLFSDQLNEAYLITVSNQRWITIVVDGMASIVALLVMMLSLSRVFNISAGSTGLITTSVLNLTNTLTSVLVRYSEVENEMNSVERLCYFANELDQEAAYHKPETAPIASWPQKGGIKFQNISFRYREVLPLVLKNLSIELQPGEKLGICGRTGAGKSSLMATLYRLNELADGKILIDGIDIGQIGLHELRSKLTIIPQDPVLFQGTIRKNLDPFNERSDLELWDVLRRCGLIQIDQLGTMRKQSEKNYHKFHLEATVEDGGINFSLGERQLIALARALVRSSKILIMDEATSSVDYETDALIQKTIAKEFKDCTVLCIAHRLKTILQYDKILVLEKGELAEYDSPLKLFDKHGIFREMCESSNITVEDVLG